MHKRRIELQIKHIIKLSVVNPSMKIEGEKFIDHSLKPPIKNGKIFNKILIVTIKTHNITILIYGGKIVTSIYN